MQIFQRLVLLETMGIHIEFPCKTNFSTLAMVADFRRSYLSRQPASIHTPTSRTTQPQFVRMGPSIPRHGIETQRD